MRGPCLLSSPASAVRPFRTLPPKYRPSQTPRTFLSVPTPRQNLEATRTLPYPSSAIYAVIADVPQYSAFLPYCASSVVTRWSHPDAHTGRRWPSEARLVVGWGGIQETFTSRIYCVPGKVVEAVGGASQTTLPPGDIQHHSLAEADSKNTNLKAEGILTHLLTRWTVRPLLREPNSSLALSQRLDTDSPAKEHTEVSLAIEFQFSNPLYSAMSAAVTSRIAAVMIEAFEERVQQVLDVDAKSAGQRPVSEGGQK